MIIPMKRTEEEYFNESKRFRAEALVIADTLKDSPLRFTITNVITMDVEITKSDLKTIVSKNTQDNRFNAFKNKVAQDIRGFLEKSVYEGWRDVIPGKHPETAYLARRHTCVCVRLRIQGYSNHTPSSTKKCLMQRLET